MAIDFGVLKGLFQCYRALLLVVCLFGVLGCNKSRGSSVSNPAATTGVAGNSPSDPQAQSSSPLAPTLPPTTITVSPSCELTGHFPLRTHYTNSVGPKIGGIDVPVIFNENADSQIASGQRIVNI